MNVHDYLVDEPISLSLAKFKFKLNNDTQCILILPGCPRLNAQQSDVQVQGTEVRHKARMDHYAAIIININISSKYLFPSVIF